MYSNLLNLLLFSFFFSFVKKEKGKRVVVNAGRRLRPKQERESRACLRVFFLSEKSTLFCGERVRGAMLRARIFCLWEGRRRRRGRQATDRPQMGRRRRANCCGQSNTRGATRESCAEKREEGYSWGKIGGQLFCLLGGGSRSAAIAALGYGHRRENGAGAVAAQAKNPAYRGLRPPNPAYPAYIP